MSLSYAEETNLACNPLDLLEEIVDANYWPHERASGGNLVVEISGGRDGVDVDLSCRIGLTR